MAGQKRPRLVAEPRARTQRKSEVRALRRNGLVPASIFGHGEPQAITVSARAIRDYLHRHAPGAILEVEIQGQTTPALIRELDRHPISGEVIALGFQRVGLRERIRAAIPVVFSGEDTLTGNDLVLERQATEVEVHGQADQLPESITVDISTAQAGDSIRIADLPLPEGMEPTKDPDTVVARITMPKVAAEVEAALEAEEAAHAVAAAGTEEEEETEAAPAA